KDRLWKNKTVCLEDKIGAMSTMSAIDSLLSMKPYSLSEDQKEEIFSAAMREAVSLHYEKSPEYRKICQNSDFDHNSAYAVEQIPFIPVHLFKKFKLKSISDSDVYKVIYSSATTSSAPSVVYLDRTTSQRQVKALVSIMSDFLRDKMDFLIFDSDATLGASQEVRSRASAIRGFLPFMKSSRYLLDNDL